MQGLITFEMGIANGLGLMKKRGHGLNSDQEHQLLTLFNSDDGASKLTLLYYY